MIRLAEAKDKQECYDLAMNIYSEFMSKHGIKMIPDNMHTTVDYFITARQVLVVERDHKVVGMVAWILVPHPANFSCMIWQEILYCCDSPLKTDALMLLRAIEAKAKELKADVMILANLSNNSETKLKRIYDRMGLTYTEAHYAKSV